MKKPITKKTSTKAKKPVIAKPKQTLGKKSPAKKVSAKTVKPKKTSTKALKSAPASATSLLTKTLDEQCAENPIIKKIIEATNEIIDPEIGIGIVDLGLIYGVTLTKRHAVITMTLTSMGCPVGPMIVEQIETLVPQIVDEIDHADTQIVWEPAWSPERMKPEVRDMVFNF